MAAASPRPAGEVNHERGAEGVRRAKRWLDRTTRAEARWLVPQKVAIPKLTFAWDDEATFSYDLGGTLRGDHLEGQEFLAECKFYTSAQGQGKMYREWLAKCYQALKTRPDRCDNFMWITFAPFMVTRWDDLITKEYVTESLIESRLRLFGSEATEEQAARAIDVELVQGVTSRLWIIVLSERQEEHLTLQKHHLALVREAMTMAED